MALRADECRGRATKHWTSRRTSIQLLFGRAVLRCHLAASTFAADWAERGKGLRAASCTAAALHRRGGRGRPVRGRSAPKPRGGVAGSQHCSTCCGPPANARARRRRDGVAEARRRGDDSRGPRRRTARSMCALAPARPFGRADWSARPVAPARSGTPTSQGGTRSFTARVTPGDLRRATSPNGCGARRADASSRAAVKRAQRTLARLDRPDAARRRWAAGAAGARRSGAALRGAARPAARRARHAF